jgi:hypothetical protein
MSFDFSSELESTPGGRVEIFTPARLNAALHEFGVCDAGFSAPDVKKSLHAAQHDGVCGLPEGLTVGGVAIRKVSAGKSGETHKRRK